MTMPVCTCKPCAHVCACTGACYRGCPLHDPHRPREPKPLPGVQELRELADQMKIVPSFQPRMHPDDLRALIASEQMARAVRASSVGIIAEGNAARVAVSWADALLEELSKPPQDKSRKDHERQEPKPKP